MTPTTTDQLYVINGSIIDHYKNLLRIMEIKVSYIKMNRYSKDTLGDLGMFKMYDLMVFLLNNDDPLISRIFPINSSLKRKFSRIRRLAKALIKPSNGRFKTQAQIDYALLIKILHPEGLRKYFNSGGTLPKAFYPNRTWVKISHPVCHAIESELERFEQPIEMVSWFVGVINQHLNFDVKDNEAIGKKILMRHLQRLFAYQKQVGGFQYINRSQDLLDLYWIFDEQTKYHHGDEDARDRTFKQLRRIIRHLIFPARHSRDLQKFPSL